MTTTRLLVLLSKHSTCWCFVVVAVVGCLVVFCVVGLCVCNYYEILLDRYRIDYQILIALSRRPN